MYTVNHSAPYYSYPGNMEYLPLPILAYFLMFGPLGLPQCVSDTITKHL